MTRKSIYNRRGFIKTSLAAGTALELSSAALSASSLTTDSKDIIRIGVVGFGPYSCANDFISAINIPSPFSPTRMKVAAAWYEPEGYRHLFRGDPHWQDEREYELLNAMNTEKLASVGVNTVVSAPEDMIDHVDAVFITDPLNSLKLAKPFLESGKALYVQSPIARSIHDVRELVRLAEINKCPLVVGSPVPWACAFTSALERINSSTIQNYYLDGTTGSSMIMSLSSMVEIAHRLTKGMAVRCTTFGFDWKADEDPWIVPPVTSHIEYKPVNDHDPVLGVISTFFGEPYRFWAKVHLDNYVVEQGILRGKATETSENQISFSSFFPIIEHSFTTGIWPIQGDMIINIVAAVLMIHKSGVERGHPVSIDEIENHTLPTHVTDYLYA